MRGFSNWWGLRTRRERRMLSVMAAIAIPVLVWLLLVMPVRAWHDDARQDYLDALDTRARIDALAGGKAGAGTAPDPQVLQASAADAGLALAAADRAGDGSVTVTIETGRANALVGWIAGLEDTGARVRRMQMTRNEDGTHALNLVLDGGA